MIKHLTKTKRFFFINHNSYLNLPLGLDVTISTRFMSPVLDGIYLSSTIFNFDISIQKDILKKKGVISLDINDLFYTYGKYSLKSNYKEQLSKTYIERSSQMIVLSFSYNFSSGNKFKKKRKESSNREELRRI